MNITKLTLTPIYKPSTNIVIRNPEPERAMRLIVERLNSRAFHIGTKTPGLKRDFNKLPEYIKNLVNPEAYVGKASKYIQ